MSIFGESKHDRREDHMEREEVRLLHEIAHTLHQIKGLLTPQQVIITSFVITQGGTPTMPVQGPLLGIAPGLSDVFSAAPVDASGNVLPLPTGSTALVTSDDPTDAITLTTPDGLNFSVSVAATATPGSLHTITVALSAPQSDGTTASTPVPLPILGTTPPPPGLVASFVVTQGAAAAAAARRR